MATDGMDETLEEAILAFVFGGEDDGEDHDPGRIVTEGAADPAVDAYLARLDAEVRELKRGLGGPVAESEALARIAALRTEVAAWGPVELEIEPPSAEVVSLAAVRERRRPDWTRAAAAIIAIAAAAVFAVVFLSKSGPEAPRITVAQAQAWSSEIEGGFGFQGDQLSPQDRGFLIGIVGDLVRSAEDGAMSAAARETAEALATRAVGGLDVAETGDALVARVAKGCEAVLADASDLAACEAGVNGYRKHRDEALAGTTTR